MLQRFERFLDLRAGELERGLLLFAYLFLVIASFVVGKSIRDALFIDEFGALLLPYADIGVATLVGLWVSVYLRLARRLSLRQLLVCSLLFFAVNCLIFWVIALNSRPAWLTPVIYVWVGMFGVVAPAQVWTLATAVLTTREAKRMYGFIGSGATSGWIVGGYLTQVIAARYGAEALADRDGDRPHGAPQASSFASGAAGQSADGEFETARGRDEMRGGLRSERATDPTLAVSPRDRVGDPAVVVHHDDGGMAVQGVHGRGNRREGCPCGIFWQVQFLRRPDGVCPAVAAHGPSAAAARPGLHAVHRSCRPAVRIDRPSRLRIADRRDRPSRHRSGAEVLDR